MSVAAEARVLWQLLRGAPNGGNHAERLQRFYAPQAAAYDGFRQRLLHGRRQLLARLAPRPGSSLVELGAGTASNLELPGLRLQSLAQVHAVDLCPALLAVARQRSRRWPQVQVVEADAALWRPPAPVDYVLLSYALTMMPDWRSTLANAISMLKPGGELAVVDYHIPHGRGGWLARHFWRPWFAHDGVLLSDEHLPTLASELRGRCLVQRLGPVPYLPGLRVPWYAFIGSRPAARPA